MIRRRRPRANPSKARGTRWESEVVKYLRPNGFPAARRNVQTGSKDIGDIGGVPYFALEAKDTQKHTLSDFVKQANREAENAGVPWGAAVIKKRHHPTAEAYVVMDLATFAEVALFAALFATERLDARETE